MHDATEGASDRVHGNLRMARNGTILAAMLAASIPHAGVAEELAVSAGEFTVQIRGLPSSGLQGGPVSFRAGGMAGYVEELAMLAGKAGAARVGMSGLFAELGSSALPIPEGLRIHAARAGADIEPNLNAMTSLVARDVSLASKPGSGLDQFLGENEAGGSFASIGRVDLALTSSSAGGTDGTAARQDELRLVLGDIRLAKTLLAKVFDLAGLPLSPWPAFSADIAARVSEEGDLDAVILARSGNGLEFRFRIRGSGDGAGRLAVEVETDDAGAISGPGPSASDSTEMEPGGLFGESRLAPGGQTKGEYPASFEVFGSGFSSNLGGSGNILGRGVVTTDHVSGMPVERNMVGFDDSRG